MKISKSWRERSKIYRYFTRDASYVLDFSENAAETMFLYESKGIGDFENIFPLHVTDTDYGVKPYNGYFLGKKLLDLQLTSWREDCYAGYYTYYDILDDFRAYVRGFVEIDVKEYTTISKYLPGYSDAKQILDWFMSIPTSNFSLSPSAKKFYEVSHRESYAKHKEILTQNQSF